MPEVDGYDLIRRVRALPAERGGRVPAVALFGPTRPGEWGCLLTSNRTLRRSAHMEDLDVPEVLAAANAMAAISLGRSACRASVQEPACA